MTLAEHTERIQAAVLELNARIYDARMAGIFVMVRVENFREGMMARPIYRPLIRIRTAEHQLSRTEEQSAWAGRTATPAPILPARPPDRILELDNAEIDRILEDEDDDFLI